MNYILDDGIAVISLDDGKANAVSISFVELLNSYLDQAEQEASAVIITGRTGMFCAGFDLKAFQQGAEVADKLVAGGMAMLTRLYEFPLPVIAACDGHAIGMGAFLLMASDNRVGANSDFQICLPETSISMPFTPVLLALIHDRISIAEKTMAVVQSKRYSPAESIAAGFLDKLVDQNSLMEEAKNLAKDLSALPKEYYCMNKRSLRKASLECMHADLK